MKPFNFQCGCPEFAKQKHARYKTTANMTGKSSQPWLVEGNIVSARCTHEAYYLAVESFLKDDLHPKICDTSKIP